MDILRLHLNTSFQKALKETWVSNDLGCLYSEGFISRLPNPSLSLHSPHLFTGLLSSSLYYSPLPIPTLLFSFHLTSKLWRTFETYSLPNSIFCIWDFEANCFLRFQLHSLLKWIRSPPLYSPLLFLALCYSFVSIFRGGEE